MNADLVFLGGFVMILGVCREIERARMALGVVVVVCGSALETSWVGVADPWGAAGGIVGGRRGALGHPGPP